LNLGLSPGDYRRGEWVYVCPCGREGELNWMKEHVRLAHGVKGSRKLNRWLRSMHKHREYVRMRERLDA